MNYKNSYTNNTEGLTEWTDEQQQGFRRERSYKDIIFIIRQIAEKSMEFNRPTSMCFIDIYYAFECPIPKLINSNFLHIFSTISWLVSIYAILTFESSP